MNIVINASPLIFLAKLGIIDVLPRLFKEFVIPQGVRSEVARGRDEAADWINENGGQYIKDVGPVPDIIMAWDLGLGESQVLAFSKKHANFIAGIDDKAARNCAKSLNLDIIGTIGLILLAQRQKSIDDATPFLLRLREFGYRIENDLFRHALDLSTQLKNNSND